HQRILEDDQPRNRVDVVFLQLPDDFIDIEDGVDGTGIPKELDLTVVVDGVLLDVDDDGVDLGGIGDLDQVVQLVGRAQRRVVRIDTLDHLLGHLDIGDLHRVRDGQLLVLEPCRHHRDRRACTNPRDLERAIPGGDGHPVTRLNDRSLDRFSSLVEHPPHRNLPRQRQIHGDDVRYGFFDHAVVVSLDAEPGVHRNVLQQEGAIVTGGRAADHGAALIDHADDGTGYRFTGGTVGQPPLHDGRL